MASSDTLVPVPAPLQDAPRITVVVCTHNRYDTLGDTLDSLAHQDLPAAEIEVLVIDNSTDLEGQKRFWRLNRPAANARLIVEETPGLSRARNIGIRAARAPLIAYIDDDALPDPQWLRVLADIFDEEPLAGVAGGPVEPIWSYPTERPSWLHPWQEGFLTIIDRGIGRRRLDGHEWLAGTNIAYRRALLVEAGGFSESLGRIGNSLLSNEELAISTMIEKRGFGSFYDSEARVFHRIHANRVSPAWFRRRVSWQAMSDQLAGVAVPGDDALWGRIQEYQQLLSPVDRGLRGLFLDTADPALFQKQSAAIDALLLLLLASGRDPDPNVVTAAT